MENLGLTHELSDEREKSLDALIEIWGADVREDWIRRYGDEVVGGAGIVSQMWRTALITVCRVREARAIAHQARLENALYGNISPGITEEMIEAYRQQKLSPINLKVEEQ